MYESTENAIETHLFDNWNNTGIDFDNVNFKPSNGVPFIRLQIEWVNSEQISIGGLDRNYGYVNISVFVEKNISNQLINNYLDELKELFSKKQLGNIKFKTATVKRRGSNRNWFRKDLIVPFQVDECN